MSLKRLVLRDCEDVDQILRNQTELEELEVGWDTFGIDQLDELSKLKSLAAPLHEAALLVPGRPIEKLHQILTFKDEDYFNDQLFRKLSPSTGPITEFYVYLFDSYKVYGVDERLRVGVQVISRNLTQLEKFTVNVSGSVSGQVVSQLSELVQFYQMQMTTLSDPGGVACISVPLFLDLLRGEPDDSEPHLFPQAGVG